MSEDVPRMILSGLILIFLISIVYIVAVTLISGFVQPLVNSLNTNQTVGITGEKFTDMSNGLWSGLKWCFYLVIALVIFIVGFKLLHEKEETSVYYGG